MTRPLTLKHSRVDDLRWSRKACSHEASNPSPQYCRQRPAPVLPSQRTTMHYPCRRKNSDKRAVSIAAAGVARRQRLNWGGRSQGNLTSPDGRTSAWAAQGCPAPQISAISRLLRGLWGQAVKEICRCRLSIMLVLLVSGSAEVSRALTISALSSGKCFSS